MCVLLVKKTEDPVDLDWIYEYMNMMIRVVNENLNRFVQDNPEAVQLDDDGFACWVKASLRQGGGVDGRTIVRVDSFADYAYMVYACLVIGERVDDWMHNQLLQLDLMCPGVNSDNSEDDEEPETRLSEEWENAEQAFAQLEEIAYCFRFQFTFEKVKAAFDSGNSLDLVAKIKLGSCLRVDLD